MFSFPTTADDDDDDGSQGDDLLPSNLSMDFVLNGSPPKIHQVTEAEVLEKGAEVDENCNAVTDVNAVINAIATSGELPSSKGSISQWKPLSISNDTVNLLDYGDETPPEFIDRNVKGGQLCPTPTYRSDNTPNP